MALDAAGVHSADSASLAYLHTQQVADGGFTGGWGPDSDADSDAEVLQALIAAGEDPLGAAWSKASGNVLTAMRAAQGTDGGFSYQTYGESAFTTREIPAALMGVPYAAVVHFSAGLSVPRTSCPSAGSSASPSASASASASTAASPTAAPTPTTRPTAAPTLRPTAAPTPTSTSAPTPTDSVAAIATPTATFTSAPTVAVAGETAAASAGSGGAALTTGSSGSNGSGGIPTPIVYALAALAGLGAVAVGGWLMLARPAKS
jgi:hypothetical protein